MKKRFRFLVLLLVGLPLLAGLLFGHRDRPVEALKPKYAPAPSEFVTVMGMDVHFRDEGNLHDTLRRYAGVTRIELR